MSKRYLSKVLPCIPLRKFSISARDKSLPLTLKSLSNVHVDDIVVDTADFLLKRIVGKHVQTFFYHDAKKNLFRNTKSHVELETIQTESSIFSQKYLYGNDFKGCTIAPAPNVSLFCFARKTHNPKYLVLDLEGGKRNYFVRDRHELEIGNVVGNFDNGEFYQLFDFGEDHKSNDKYFLCERLCAERPEEPFKLRVGPHVEENINYFAVLDRILFWESLKK